MPTASEIIKVKELLPTSLGSEDIRKAFASEILQRSVFSARMTEVEYLRHLRDTLDKIATGEINDATARKLLMDRLISMGHNPRGGGMKNPAGVRRLQLIVNTNRHMATSVARIRAQTPETLRQWPAWELLRKSSRIAPRDDWPARWMLAGDSVSWQGALKGNRMIALKDSPIWAALGDGGGVFRDTLGNPYPPFAYASGLGWAGVSRDEAVKLGLIKDDYEAPGKLPGKLAPDEQEILEAARKTGLDKVALGAE